MNLKKLFKLFMTAFQEEVNIKFLKLMSQSSFPQYLKEVNFTKLRKGKG